LAYYPEVEHLIVSLQHSQPRLAAWIIRDEMVEAADVQIAANPSATVAPHLPDSASSTTAILITAVLAFLLVLVVALTLLPPPPPLMG
jgi:hypothetical protein